MLASPTSWETHAPALLQQLRVLVCDARLRAPPLGAGIRNRLKSLHFEAEAGDFYFGFVSLCNCIK
jgi:hypothetical protein